MTKDKPTNLPASVRQRLLDLARKERQDFQWVLTRYAVERLLFRISRSVYREQFILKGAMLFQLWGAGMHRPTRDLDLLGRGPHTTSLMVRTFQELCTLDVPDDGLRFLKSSIQAEVIQAEQEYEGIRVHLEVRLENARIRLQIDVGFGDVVTPAPETIAYPTVLDFPAPVLQAYPKESVVAEKLQSMVVLGIANSRMKDFYDLWYLATHYGFDGRLLSKAVQKTFAQRHTPVPTILPFALTAAFAEDAAKILQWKSFIEKAKLMEREVSLQAVVTQIRNFAGPVLQALSIGAEFNKTWDTGPSWS